MRTILVGLVLCTGIAYSQISSGGITGASGSLFNFGSATSMIVPTGTGAAPGTCTVGTLYFRSATGSPASNLSVCDPTNTFNAIGVPTTSLPLSSLTSATASSTLANGDNPIVWNWTETTNSRVGFTIGETTASTSGTTTSYLMQIATLAGSTLRTLNVTGSLTGSEANETVLINPTWNTSANPIAALYVNPTKVATGGNARLLRLSLGGVSQFDVNEAGIVTSANSMVSGNNVQALAGAKLLWAGSSTMKAPSDGVIELSNAAVSDFSRLQFGGTTSSFPSLKRSTTSIAVRLADDSADAPITASNATLTGAIIMAGTKPTITGCGTISSQVGGALAGTFVTNATSCTPVLTVLPTAPTGYKCYLNDQTTAVATISGLALGNLSSTTTTATFPTFITVASDVIGFICEAF